MRLSVKIFLGLAAFVAVVLALVGQSSTSQAVDGKIYVTNNATGFTNESPAPKVGQTSTGTVYVTTDRSGALIRQDSDTVTLRAYAPAANKTSTEKTAYKTANCANSTPPGGGAPGVNCETDAIDGSTKASEVSFLSGASLVSTSGSAAGALAANTVGACALYTYDDTDGVNANDGDYVNNLAEDCATGTAGSTVVLQVGAATVAPIIGTLAEVQASTKIYAHYVDSTGTIAGTLKDAVAEGWFSITGFHPGNGVDQAPWISYQVNVNRDGYLIRYVQYSKSSRDVLPISVTSELTQSGTSVQVWAEETGLNTGVFEAEVKIIANTNAAVDLSTLGPKMGNALVSNGNQTIFNGTPGEANETAEIRSTSGPVTFSFPDGIITLADDGATPALYTGAFSCATAAGGTCATRSTTVSLDTTAPEISITAPVHGSSTQSHALTFTGTWSDQLSGLMKESLQLTYDDAETAAVVYVVAAPTPASTALAVELVGNDVFRSTAGTVKKLTPTGAELATISNGQLSYSFSLPAVAAVPSTAPTGAVEAVLDFGSVIYDVAGNVALTDSSATDAGYQMSTLEIDTVAPSLITGSAATGYVNNSSNADTAATSTSPNRNSIRVAFNDKLQGVEASDFTVTLDSGAVVVPSSATLVNSGSTVANAQSRVYLLLPDNLVSSDTPKVKLVGEVQDLAGNSVSTGEAESADGVPPLLTVTISGGSGGAQLSRNTVTLNITSDEQLTSGPDITADDNNGGALTVTSTPASSQGGLTWSKVVTVSGLSEAKHYFEVSASGAGGTTTYGSIDPAVAPAGMVVTVDTSIATPTWAASGATVAQAAAATGSTSQARPVVQFEFASEPSVITLAQVTLQKGSAAATDITSEVVKAASGQKFYWVPSVDLEAGVVYTITLPAAKVTDSSGNTNTGAAKSLALTINSRTKFAATVYAGWNAISFPSSPVDTDINSVFSSASHDAVLGYDSSVPGQWRVALRDAVSGLLVPATENGLSTISETQAYWVHSVNFDPVSVLLVGPSSSVAGTPPSVVTMGVTKGFNAIAVVDPTKKRVGSGDFGQPVNRVSSADGSTLIPVTVKTYLGNVSYGRVYTYNAAALRFEEATDSKALKAGEVLFVEVLADGILVP